MRMTASDECSYTDESSFLLTEREAARRLGLSPGTLRNWRSRGRGPIAVRFGSRCVRYRVSDVDSYIDAHVAGGRR